MLFKITEHASNNEIFYRIHSPSIEYFYNCEAWIIFLRSAVQINSEDYITRAEIKTDFICNFLESSSAVRTRV
jgi:hypothetical protein